MSLPNFFIIGVQKAGTTSLHNWLSQHHEIYSNGNLKDIDFFMHPTRSKDPLKSITPYLHDYKNQKYILQTHVNYILYEQALARIRDVCGSKTKFILVLRNPVERALSAYKYFVKVKREERTLDEALFYTPKEITTFSHDNNDFTYLEHGFYYKQIQVFEKYFQFPNLLLIDFNLLKYQPEECIKEAFNFLNIDKNIEIDYSIKNRTGNIRNNRLQHFLYKPNLVKKTFIKIINPFIDHKKRKLLKQRISELNTSNKSGDIVFNETTRRKIYNLYEQDMIKLYKHYKIDFVKNWFDS